MIGWLLDTNVVSTLANPNGAPSVKNWAAGQDESRFFLSVLTLGEFDKGIHNLPDDHPNRPRYAAARDRLEERFAGRIISVTNAVVRRWGQLSGSCKRSAGSAPPVIDALLAASALEFDLYLVTRNVKDVRDCGAQIFDPWSDDPARFAIDRRRPSNR